MMIFTTDVPAKLMLNRHLMVAFQVRQNATTVTLLTSGDRRHSPTAACLQTAGHTRKETVWNNGS